MKRYLVLFIFFFCSSSNRYAMEPKIPNSILYREIFSRNEAYWKFIDYLRKKYVPQIHVPCIETQTSTSIGCVHAMSPNHRFLASGSWDGTVRIWLVDNNSTSAFCLKTLQHHGWVTSVTWSPDGTAVSSIAQNQTVKIWDLSPLLAVYDTYHKQFESLPFEYQSLLCGLAHAHDKGKKLALGQDDIHLLDSLSPGLKEILNHIIIQGKNR